MASREDGTGGGDGRGGGKELAGGVSHYVTVSVSDGEGMCSLGRYGNSSHRSKQAGRRREKSICLMIMFNKPKYVNIVHILN